MNLKSKTHINLNIDNDLLALIDKEALELKIPRSAYFQRIIRQFYNQRELYKEFYPDVLSGIQEILNRMDKYENQSFSDFKSPCGGSEAEARNPEGTENIDRFFPYLDTLETLAI